MKLSLFVAFMAFVSIGYTQEKSYDYKDFDAVSFSQSITVEIKQGKNFSVKASAEKQEYLDDVKVSVKEGMLVVKNNYKINWSKKENREVHFVVEMPTLRFAEFSGASEGDIQDFKEEKMIINISGASRANINVEAKNLEITLSGATKVILSGTGNVLEAEASGASKLDAGDFEANEVIADASGASKINVFSKEKLTADASGASKISYAGNPSHTEKNSYGVSKITAL